MKKPFTANGLGMPDECLFHSSGFGFAREVRQEPSDRSCCGTSMSLKCIKISIGVCFFIFTGCLFVLFLFCGGGRRGNFPKDEITVTFPKPDAEAAKVQCSLEDLEGMPFPSTRLKEPSLESFIRASSTEEDQELRLGGLAVYSKLTNACQPPVDVSKSNIHVNKIALIAIANEAACPLPEVAVNAQKAGYSVVIIYYSKTDFELQSSATGSQADIQDKLLIPALNVFSCTVLYPNETTLVINSSSLSYLDSFFLDADRSYVEISVDIPQNADFLSKMKEYLKRLYFWFLLGPLMTLEWLRRTKKFCCMSGGQQVNEERGIEDEEAVGDSSLHSVLDETQENNNQETEHEQTASEEQPLIIVTCSSDPQSNLTNTEHTRHPTIRRVITLFAGKFAVGWGYVILIIAALPVGISSGGWSFFRFDENEDVNVKSFCYDVDIPEVTGVFDTEIYTTISNVMMAFSGDFCLFSPLWWSTLQIFCFFLYSYFACKTTWTVPTNFSKLIRSDWFASNVYLLILGVVVPYCSLDFKNFSALNNFIFFTTYNTICQICNLLFIIILNKHNFVTRYVFYISVCMICAYVESDIVAVFYFMLNSEGSLNNLKLTALRTVAIGYTLTLSFSSSMHIVRKLTKPQESLFEGLGEK